jgi:hypothetical protein
LIIKCTKREREELGDKLILPGPALGQKNATRLDCAEVVPETVRLRTSIRAYVDHLYPGSTASVVDERWSVSCGFDKRDDGPIFADKSPVSRSQRFKVALLATLVDEEIVSP